MKRAILVLLCWLLLASCGLPPGKPSAKQLEQIEQAVEETIQAEQENVLAFIVAKTEVENIKISRDGKWAVSWIIPIDTETGEPAPIEPGLVLLEKVGDDWQVWLPTTDGWTDTLAQIPDEILPPMYKTSWERRNALLAVDIPDKALKGYYLPWAAGITRRLTQSVCHDRYIPSGNAHFSFDFATYQELWDIHAIKGGEVWLWKDDVPTCYELTCSDDQPVGNYIVIRDRKTTPTTYHLYLHLKQNSIPDNLKIKGMPVSQGQFLANVDNTGQSWGHHLHLQVQVPLYGDNYYWGKSVDIRFKDVPYNGGRPRVINSFCDDARYCDEPGDVCEEFHTYYTSMNQVNPAPPTPTPTPEPNPSRLYLPYLKR